jgi:hypothetical protein
MAPWRVGTDLELLWGLCRPQPSNLEYTYALCGFLCVSHHLFGKLRGCCGYHETIGGWLGWFRDAVFETLAAC